MQSAYQVNFAVFSMISKNQFMTAFSELSSNQLKFSTLFISPDGAYIIQFSRTAITASIFITIMNYSILTAANVKGSQIAKVSMTLLETMLVIANISTFNINSVIRENESEINEAFSNLFNQ